MKTVRLPALCRPRALFWLLSACALCTAQAHKLSDSYLTVRVEGAALTGQWDIALRDLEQAVSLDTNEDGTISPAEVKSSEPEIARYATSRLHLKTGDAPLGLSVTEQLMEEFSDGTYAVLRFEVAAPLSLRELEVD